MSRKKVRLAYITKDSARKATFKKRKRGLLKKVFELRTLCGIDACAIIFSPFDYQPEIYPSPSDAQWVISQFKKMPEMEQNKKMVSQERFLQERIDKAKERLQKQRKDNRDKEITKAVFQGLTGKTLWKSLNIMDLKNLEWLIDQNLKEICSRMGTLNKGDTSTIGTTNNNTVVADHPSASSSFQAVAAMATSGGGEIMGQRIMEKGVASEFDYQMNSNMIMMDAMQQQQQQKQQQQWFLEMISQPQEYMGFGGDEMIFPFGDATCGHNTLWTNDQSIHYH